MNLNEVLNELLKQHSKRDIILALEALTASISPGEYKTMKGERE